MKIKKIKVKNFRLLSDSELELNDKLSYLIGKNNSGKTSFLVLFDKFYNQKGVDFDDYPLKLRKSLLGFNAETNIHELAIHLLIQIEYSDNDNLKDISEFITNLKETSTTVSFGFEYLIDSKKLLEKTKELEGITKERFIRNNIGNYIKTNVFVYNDEKDFITSRHKLVDKKLDDVKNLINFQFIHAKRNVASSEDISEKKKMLSQLTTKFYNSKNGIEHTDKTINNINDKLLEVDKQLDKNYESFFKPFLANAKSLLDLSSLCVVSDLKSKEILEHSSKVVYGKDESLLPEHLNGLGYLNILYLLLQLEICKEQFINEKKDINLLFIEEPEAHTHPQMQYVFAKEIKRILNTIDNLQTIITTHSPYIISQSDFDDIKYFQLQTNSETKCDNILIKNFGAEMVKKYSDDNSIDQWHYIQQFLTLQSSELFFSEKAIFIEGISERILINLFMSYHDKPIIKLIEAERTNAKEKSKEVNTEICERENEILLSQNITILEVGANAKAFKHFLDFLGVKVLIITDLDSVTKTLTTKDNKTVASYKKSSVVGSNGTSNATLKDFFGYEKCKDDNQKSEWYISLVEHKLVSEDKNIYITYQKEENNYHARSFEDAFISSNLTSLVENKSELRGIKNNDELKSDNTDIYTLTDDIIDKKSHFASSIYFLASQKDKKTQWQVPSYIKEGLEWLAKKP